MGFATTEAQLLSAPPLVRQSLGLIVALLLERSYKSAKALQAKMVDEAKAKYSEEESFDMGDRSPLFKYVL
ncbi:hypothetical protein LY78DRAFT_686327 [Colletotrichum sublineola]|nr:hypothetical protein LY78DRAFT_686327 [Colletotrichum sublineola]